MNQNASAPSVPLSLPASEMSLKGEEEYGHVATCVVDGRGSKPSRAVNVGVSTSRGWGGWGDECTPIDGVSTDVASEYPPLGSNVELSPGASVCNDAGGCSRDDYSALVQEASRGGIKASKS